MKDQKSVETKPRAAKKKINLDQALEEVSRKLRPEAAFTGVTITEISGCPCCWS